MCRAWAAPVKLLSSAAFANVSRWGSNWVLAFTSTMDRPPRGLGHHAPYFPSRPAWASAMDIKYFAGNCPRPPRRQYDSPNSTTPSGRQERAHRRMGTGCQLWLLSLLGVLWSPVTIR